MTGYLIYSKEGLERNRWFAEKFLLVAKEKGTDLKIILDSEVKNNPLPHFAVVRVINPSINSYFEQKGVLVFNNYKTSLFANDKWKTFCLAKKLGIETLKTYLPNEKPAFPVVVKSVDGCGGKEVFLVKDEQELERATKPLKNYILQEVCSDVGKDARVYCLGDRIVATMLRQSETDFRSNFSLGASATEITADKQMINTVKKLQKELDFSLVGVDFIRHKGKWVLNEIEDVVGTRMLYSKTQIDIVNEYMEYIIGLI